MFSKESISWGCILHDWVNEDVFIDEDKLERVSGYSLLNLIWGVPLFVVWKS